MISRVRTFLALVGSTAIAMIASTLAATAPASAAWSDCPNGYFCLFTGPNGSGQMFYTAAQPAQLGFMNNDSESYWNRSVFNYCLFNNQDHQVFRTQSPAGFQGNFSDGLANQISSLGKVGGGHC